MKLRLALEEKLMDVRVRDRLIAEGKITKKEVEAYLNSLNDDKGNSQKVAQDSSSTANE